MAHPSGICQGPSLAALETRQDRLTIKGIENVHEVTPHLYSGGKPTKTGLRNLARMGFGIIIDGGKGGGHERAEATRLGMQFVSLPWWCTFPKDRIFAQFLAVIRKNPDKKIFVHCHLGDDRTGMLIASYRMAEQGWTSKQAMAEMRRNGFSVGHQIFLCPGLAQYEKEFPQRYQDAPLFHASR